MHRVAAALACFALLALMAASGESARADEPYPSKPIRLVLPSLRAARSTSLHARWATA